MRRLITGIGNEFYKLAIKKKYIVFLVIAIAVSFTRVGSNALIAKLSAGAASISTGNIPMTMLGFFSELLVPLVVFMAATDLIATEAGEGTLKAALLLPQSRMKVLTSKVMATFLMGMLYYIILLISCFIIEAVYGGNIGVHMIKTIGAYLIDLIPLFVLTLMAAVINLASKSSTLAMFLCILIYALMKYMIYFVPGANSILFTAYSQWHRLWIGSTLPIRALLPKIGVVVGWGVLTYGAAFVMMDKKEL